MAHSQEPPDHLKRKRDTDDSGSQSAAQDRTPQLPPPQSGSTSAINYLSKPSIERLRFIQGDAESFVDILRLIGEYEGVLSRQESLAASLGAKLTGPRLLKAMESMFEGPITTHPPQTTLNANTVSWLDILHFSKAYPSQFTLSTTPDGRRVCQIPLKGTQVEITEDDWRIIMSGALESFKLGASNQPLEEDEAAELATLEIVEKEVLALVKNADEVAKRARQLNYQLRSRKAAIHSRRQQLVGQQPARGVGSAAGYDLHADLLQQFTAHTHLTRSRTSSAATALAQSPATPYGPPSAKTFSQQRVVLSGSRPLAASPASALDYSQLDGSSHQSPVDDPSARYKPLITRNIERLEKGEGIFPPCDRCRRLKLHCVKHLTACQGCTKKHAKCGWKSVTDEEIARLRSEVGVAGESEAPELAVVSESEDVGSVSRLAPAARDDAATVTEGSQRSDSGDWRRRPSADERFEVEANPFQRRPDAQMNVDQPQDSGLTEWEGRAGAGNYMIAGHSLLSHMASVASARAEARDAREGLDTSSTSSNTPRH